MSTWRDKTADQTYVDDEIAARLDSELPNWRHEHGAICRLFRTAGWKGTLMVVNTVGHLAEVAWHHPDIAASYNSVDVKLVTHSAGGVTNKDFELARKIEQVVMWQPGSDANSALEGIPDDARFSYIVDDR